jgi:tetratricopeptide (TPR) repeat protein
MLISKSIKIKKNKSGINFSIFSFYFFITALMSYSFSFKFALAEQYKSYIIINEEKKSNNLLTTPDLLAQNLDKINQAQRAVAERFLARHFVEQKQYSKAINFYLKALSNEVAHNKIDNQNSSNEKPNNEQPSKAMSIYAKQQMLEELSYVYLLNQQYQDALNTLNKLQQVDNSISQQKNNSKFSGQQKAFQVKENKRKIRNTLMHAQALFYLQKYDEATLVLSKVFNQSALSKNSYFTPSDVEQALYFYYHMQANLPAANCLSYLLLLMPNKKSYWQTLAYVYQKMGLLNTALDTLVLAEKQFTQGKQNALNNDNSAFDQANYDWLINLYIENKLFYQAASKLSELLEQKRYPDKAQAYYQLFSLWFHAKEFDLALEALNTSAKLQQSPEYFIQLAQLHLQQNNWVETEKAVLSACKNGLKDEQVGIANLLLGVQYAHRGEREQSKLAFYNANLMGGTVQESAQWLKYLNNGKVEKTLDPYRPFTGICVPKSELSMLHLLTSTKEKEFSIKKATSITEQLKSEQEQYVEKTQAKAKLNTIIKSIDDEFFYGVKIAASPESIQSKIFNSALRINKALFRKQKKSNGSLQLLIDSRNFFQDNKMNFTLAVPTSTKVTRTMNLRPIKMPQSRAYSYIFTGSLNDSMAIWKKLNQHALEQGEEPCGKNRLIFLKRNGNDDLELELLLGIL